MAAQTFLVHADLNQNELDNAVIQPLASNPVSSPKIGQIYFNTGTNRLRTYNGSTWDEFVTASGITGVILNQPGRGFTISPSGSSASSFTFSLTTELDNMVNNASSTGLHIRTGGGAGAGTWAFRTIAQGTGVTVTNGDGISGNPTISIGQAVSSSDSPTFSNVTISNTPTNSTHAATKAYVDSLVQGLKWKQSCRAATTANISLTAGTCPNTVDGVLLVAGDRVLVKNQSALPPTLNGIYAVTTAGTGSNGTWARDTDADTWTELISATVVIQEGTTNADTMWNCIVDPGGTLGTTGIQWVSIGVSASVASSLISSSGGSIVAQGPTVQRVMTFPDANATLLSSAATVTVGQGGTGATTLTGLLRGNGTNAITGSSTVSLTSEVTGLLPITNGGLGTNSWQTALNNLAGSTAAGNYLRGNGTNVVMGNLLASDLTGTVAVANGGTGFTSGTFTRKVSGNCTASATQNFTHSLNTTDVHVQVWETSGSLRQVIVQIAIADANNVNITFNTAPTAGQYRIVCIG